MVRQFNYLLIFILLNFCAAFSNSLNIKILSEKDLANFSIIPERIIHTGTDASVRKVTDGKNLYILKQINDESLDEQFLLINDCIASTIGCNLKINVNEVFFIPFNVASYLKIFPARAATLHQYIQGKDLEKEMPKFLSSDFTLHQRVISKYNQTCVKDPMLSSRQGLTKSIIESMNTHQSLPAIVALDTFTGNSDRSEPNIFYNAENNVFCGIDQAAAFTKKLPNLASERLNELIEQKYFDSCSQDTLYGLKLYKETLFQLCENIKPNLIIQAMQDLVANLASQSTLIIEIAQRMHFHSSIINNNYQSCLKLIELLDRICKDKEKR